MPTKQAKSDLKDARRDLEKKFGPGTVMVLGEEEPVAVEVIPTGLLSLDFNIRRPDQARGVPIGGLPRGRITELFGSEGGGKSTLSMQVIAKANQICKRYVALVDVEHTFDEIYAAKLGVDVENLIVSQPGCGEEALDVADTLIKSGAVDLVVIDSVAMLTPKAEIEGEIGDSHVGGRARLVTQAISKLVPILQKCDTAVVFINQLREKIGYSGYGDPYDTPCGRSLKHNASLRIEIRRIGMLKISDKIVGARTRFRVAKNKLGSPFKETQGDLIFGRGFCREGDLIDFGVEMGVLKKAGASYEFEDEKFIRGREVLRQNLIENLELAQRVEQAILKLLNNGAA